MVSIGRSIGKDFSGSGEKRRPDQMPERSAKTSATTRQRFTTVRSRHLRPKCGRALLVLDRPASNKRASIPFPKAGKRHQAPPSTGEPVASQSVSRKSACRKLPPSPERRERSPTIPKPSQQRRAPFGTGRSTLASTMAPVSSAKPSVRTSEMNFPIWRGGKFTTAMTWRPTSCSGV